MMTSTLDPVQKSEQDYRATARLAWAIASDSFLNADPAEAFRQRGHGRYLQKDATNPILSTDTAVLGLLDAAFLGAVDRRSLLGQIPGALRLPLTAAVRLQVGTVVASRVAENLVKPVARLDFDIPDPPVKVVAEIVASAEALRAIDLKSQSGLSQVLVAATAGATDTELVTRLTAAAAAGAADPGTLLAAVGSLRYPVLISDYAGLLSLAAGTVRDLQAIGVTILATDAAAGVRIALDGAGLLIGEDSVSVQVARHAQVLLDDGGSPTGAETVNLFQMNLASIRSERWLRIAVRASAVAWASI